MYTSFFGLVEKPFAITPDPRYLFMSERHAEALAHLLYGINEAGGFIQLTGEVGTGKTTVIRSLLARAPRNAELALILNPRMEDAEFILTVCEELGIGVPDDALGSVKELSDILNRYLLRAHAEGRREARLDAGGDRHRAHPGPRRRRRMACTGHRRTDSGERVRPFPR